ncbi:DnaJ-domain-containing protein [Fistulina hepatica ATCC 64428]|uniref:DnaJ-domain-containing protein n=1 Tax=Fistulina hepatica ATCC 64428 TaxID=1128425 RepID=A0A0D7AJX2_9AGAR|nr:DnaJ-domain-containing protein [Fistulina hepatica ATCC 64428]
MRRSSKLKRTAYRVQVLKHHPDKNIDDADGATARFQRIQQAYQILTDPNRRREYDAERLRAKSQEGVPKPTHSDPIPGEWYYNEPQPTQSWSEWFGSWVGLGGRCPAKFDFERYRKLRPLYFRMSVVNDFDVPDEGINLDDIANFFQYLKTCGDLEFTDSNDEPGKKNAYDVYGNFFACIAYDEIALMTPHCIEIPPDFGCPHCVWNMNDMVYVGALNAACPSFTSDFYEYWTRFSTRKGFRAYVKYMIPENTLPHDAKFMRRENRDFQHEMRKKYNSVIRASTVSRLSLSLQERYLFSPNLCLHSNRRIDLTVYYK